MTAMLAASAALPHPAGGQEAGDGILPPGDWSAEQRAELLDLVARTEAGLPAFADVDEIQEMGFIDFGVTVESYAHFINWDWMDDGHVLDPNYPESLVFHVTWDEEFENPTYELVSAMYFLPGDTTMETIPADLAWMPGWHVHPDVCVDDVDHTFAGLAPCGAGSHGWEKPPMLHVWIKDNRCGHRFGGIDIGGLHCDVHGHPGPHDPGHPQDPGHPHDPGHPQDPGHPHDPGNPQDPGHPHNPGQNDGHQHHNAPPAQPVHQHPHVTG